MVKKNNNEKSKKQNNQKIKKQDSVTETTKTNSKIIKIGKVEIEVRLWELIFLAFLLLIIILYFTSPKVYLVTTARYNQGTKEDQINVETALGKENTEERFEIYFQWYNVIHELGHGVKLYNSNIKISSAEEEQLVNDFAVAYWLHYGEEEKLKELEDIVNYAAENIKSDAKEGQSYMEFAESNWNKSSFFTFNNYGWFQFSSVKESLKNKKTLEEVLKEMEIENIEIPSKETLEYDEITEEVSTKIINDAVENFNEWGLEFPKTYQTFNNDPNANYSRGGKNFLGIYDFIYK